MAKKLIEITIKVIVIFPSKFTDKEIEETISEMDYSLSVSGVEGYKEAHIVDTQWFGHKVTDTSLAKFS